jgi:hypothetical protein
MRLGYNLKSYIGQAVYYLVGGKWRFDIIKSIKILLERKNMKKIVIFLVLIITFLCLIFFSTKRVSYVFSVCAYCGAGSNLEGRIIGKTIKTQPPWFPSANPPEHQHFFVPLAGHNSGLYWDAQSDAIDILSQLRKLKDKNQLSDDVIKEWFSINVRNHDELAKFAQEHNLEVKE